MATFGQIAEKIKSIDLNKIFYDIMSEDFVKDWIIESNLKQLSDAGENKYGEKLQTYKGKKNGMPYAMFTISHKSTFGHGIGKITDHVTLYQTGSFYKSFKVFTKKGEFSIKADERDIADNIDMTGVVGLNAENWRLLVWKIVYPRFLKRIQNVL